MILGQVEEIIFGARGVFLVGVVDVNCRFHIIDHVLLIVIIEILHRRIVLHLKSVLLSLLLSFAILALPLFVQSASNE